MRTLALTAALALAIILPAALTAQEPAKPGKITGLMAMPYGSDSIYAAWGEPESGGKPTKYLVQARNADGGTIHRQWVDADTFGHLFECLSAGETYKIRVRAANGEGRGPVTVEKVELPDGDGESGGSDCSPGE